MTKKFEQPRMTDAQLQQFVLDYLAGHITLGQFVPDDLKPMVFMPLTFMSKGDLPDAALLADVYGNRRTDRTVNLAVNGFPIFFSCAFIRKDDMAIAAATIEREQKKGLGRVELAKPPKPKRKRAKK